VFPVPVCFQCGASTEVDIFTLTATCNGKTENQCVGID